MIIYNSKHIKTNNNSTKKVIHKGSGCKSGSGNRKRTNKIKKKSKKKINNLTKENKTFLKSLGFRLKKK